MRDDRRRETTRTVEEPPAAFWLTLLVLGALTLALTFLYLHP